ncbi:MAG: hypothetical protein AABZ06_01980 [Bdellovibrionota bacterium]
MVLLHDAIESKKLDIRIIERNIAKGVVTSAEVDKHLQQLPDDSENADWVSIESLSQEEIDDRPNGSQSLTESGNEPIGQAGTQSGTQFFQHH